MGREVRVTIVGDARQFERTLQRADRSMDRVGRSAGRLQTALAAGLVGVPVVRGLEQVVRTTTEFDTSMRQVSAVSDASGRDLERLEEIARKTGLQVGTGARAAAEGQVELAKAGLGVRDIGPALTATLQMAQAGSLGTAEAANAAANALNTFNMRGSETSKVADALANAANLTTADVGDFALALTQGGSAAQLLGMDLTETVTVLTQLAQIGIKGSDAGTSLKSAMLAVTSPTDAAGEAMKRYGLSFFEANGEIKATADISQMLRRQLGDLTREQQVQVLKTVAGSDGFRTFAAMMRHTGSSSRELSRELTRQGSAAKTAAEMQSGLQGQWNRLKASGEELSLEVGERLAPRLGELADQVSKLAADPETAEQLLRMVDGAVATGERLWEVAEPAAEGVATLARAIAELPAPIQQTMLQLVALSAIAGKVRGAAGLTGLASSTRAMRRELAAVPADAARAQAALGAVTVGGGTPAANGRGPASRIAKPPVQLVQVPAGRLGETGTGALQMRTMSAAQVSQHTLTAQREQAAAARAAVQARRGLAQAEQAEIAAQRQAIAARAVPRTQQNATVRDAEIKASAERVTAAQRARAAAVENVAATTAESRAARQRLATAQQIQQQATREARAATAAGRTQTADLTRRQRLAAAARARMPQASGRGAAMVVGAGTIGGAMSGGNVATGAMSGAALGSMAGPWGIAGGAVIGAASTAVIKEIQSAKTERVEEASKKFAARVQRATQRGVDVGMANPQDGARASATLREGEAIKRQLESAVKGGDFDKIRKAQDRAKAAGLDPKALLRGDSKALEQAGRDAVAAFTRGIKSAKYQDARSMMDQFAATFAGAPRAAQQQGANAMIELARSMEKSGAAPKGTVDRLIKQLDQRFNGLGPKVGRSVGSAVQRSTREVDKALNDGKLSRSADKLNKELSQQFGQLPRIAVRSVPGAVAALGASLRQLEKTARDRNASKEIREAAQRELPKVRRAYDQALDRMAERLGMSEGEVEAWADQVVAQAAKAGGGRTSVDDLTNSVQALNDTFTTGKADAAALASSLDDLGVSAGRVKQAIEDGEMAISLRTERDDLPRPPGSGPKKKPKKKRAGGAIRLQTGGLVPALMSGGEEYLPPDVAAQYPAGMLEAIERIQAPHFRRGGPVGRYNLGGMIIPGPSDRDGTPVMAEPGGFVLTGDGIALRDAMLGYRDGGKVRRAKVGYTVFDDEPPGAFGALTRGYAELGTATRAGKGTGVGHIARALGMRGELAANTPLTVQIGSRSAVLLKRDRGYGQGGDGTNSDPRYALDVWRDSWTKLGLNASSKGTATVTLGRGGENDQTYSTTERRSVGRSSTRGGILDDAIAAGIQAVETYGSRRAARLQGGAPVVGQIREGLEQLKDSYTRRRDYNVPGRDGPSGSSKIQAGGGWGGSQRIVEQLTAGMSTVTSRKRDANHRLSRSNPGSDHNTANRGAYAVDISPGSDAQFATIAKRAGVQASKGSWNKFANRPVQGYQTQILWHAPDGSHKDHIHTGVKKLRRGGAIQRLARGGRTRPGRDERGNVTTGISGSAPRAPHRRETIQQARGIVEGLWQHAQPFLPGSTATMPPVKFGANRGGDALWLANLTDLDGAREGRYTTLPWWALQDLVHGPRGAQSAMAETVLHEWAHHLQTPRLRRDGTETETEGGAQAWTRKFGNRIFRAAGAAYRVQSAKGDAYGRAARRVREHYGDDWVTRGQFTDNRVRYPQIRKRRGGAIQRLSTGGGVRPTRAMSSALARVEGTTSDAALTGLQAALEGAALAQVEAMRRDLQRRVRAKGDAQANARLRAALDLVTVDLAGRIQERLVRVGELGSDWERKTAEGQHWMRRTGTDPGSVRGLQVAQTNAQTYLRSQSGSELRAANKAIDDARHLLRTADSDAERATARGVLNTARDEKQRILDARTEARTVIEEMQRQLPRARAAERVQQLDLGEARARVDGRTPETDAGALAAREAELQTQLQQAVAARDSGWQLEVLQSLAGVRDSVRALPAQQAAKADAKLDFAAAVAALTETTEDDRQVLADRQAEKQRQADEAIARMNAAQNDADREAAQGEATAHLSALKAIKDEIAAGNTAQQERDARDEEIRDYLKTIAENTQRAARGSELTAANVAGYRAGLSSGDIARNVNVRGATPGRAGRVASG